MYEKLRGLALLLIEIHIYKYIHVLVVVIHAYWSMFVPYRFQLMIVFAHCDL